MTLDKKIEKIIFKINPMIDEQTEIASAISTYIEEHIEEIVELDEFNIKDSILDYECKLNGAVLVSDEYYDFVRGLSKALTQKKGIIKIKKEIKCQEQ